MTPVQWDKYVFELIVMLDDLVLLGMYVLVKEIMTFNSKIQVTGLYLVVT